MSASNRALDDSLPFDSPRVEREGVIDPGTDRHAAIRRVASTGAVSTWACFPPVSFSEWNKKGAWAVA